MSCSHCPHCRALAARSKLVLTGPPINQGAAGIDVPFYVMFVRAYDQARALGPQPMRRLRDVNPWLTESQCKSYLKRARMLGLVQTSVRAVRPAASDSATPASMTVAGRPFSELARAWRDYGDRVDVAMACAGASDTGRLDEDEARQVLREWVAADLAEWDGDDAVRFIPVAG